MGANQGLVATTNYMTASQTRDLNGRWFIGVVVRASPGGIGQVTVYKGTSATASNMIGICRAAADEQEEMVPGCPVNVDLDESGRPVSNIHVVTNANVADAIIYYSN